MPTASSSRNAQDHQSAAQTDSPLAPNHMFIEAVDARPPQPVNYEAELDNKTVQKGPLPVDATHAAERPSGSRTKFLGRTIELLRPYMVLAIACGGSLCVGGALATWLLPAQAPASQEAARVEPSSESTLVYASTLRRHEPIQPLVPFDDLDGELVELGRRLFHEPALSKSGKIACATCHSLDTGGTLHAPLPQGIDGETALYNAPTVLNAALNFAQSWDGRVSTLEEYVDIPISSPHEFGSSWERVTKFLSSDPYFRDAFPRIMQGEPTPERVRTALATFQRSLITVNSKFDQWLQGTEAALTSDEYGGYFLFKKFGCTTCHQGVGVGGSMFQPLGVAKNYFSKEPSQADLGRYNVTGQERDRHVFRVPQLRNVELTAPYFHNGSVSTLEKAVALMIEYQSGQEFNPEDVRRLTAFLKSLTGDLPVTAHSLSKSTNVESPPREVGNAALAEP